MNRTCALCKTKAPQSEMIKLGKDFMCLDEVACYKRKLSEAK